MPHRLLLGLAALLVTTAAAAQDVTPALATALSSARQIGCGDGALRRAGPLRPSPALAAAARRIARGEGPREAARAEHVRSTRMFHAMLGGYDSGAAVARAVAERYCDALTNPQLTDVGVYRDAHRWWLLLAAPVVLPHASDASVIAARVLALTNEARASRRQCGDRWFPPAPPLRASTALARAAAAHASDMARHDVLDHRGSDGSTPADRVTRAGYPWGSVGENIASGQATAERVVEDWLKSPPHCATLMGARFEEMGLAFAVNEGSERGVYWAQEFGRPASFR